MRLDKTKFRRAVRGYTQARLSEDLGISQPSVSRKLKDLDNLRFREFFEICDLIGEKPERFIICEDRNGAVAADVCAECHTRAADTASGVRHSDAPAR